MQLPSRSVGLHHGAIRLIDERLPRPHIDALLCGAVLI
jgi:hypothetical protein